VQREIKSEFCAPFPGPFPNFVVEPAGNSGFAGRRKLVILMNRPLKNDDFRLAN
jgi:hypothetical protein